MNVTVAPDRRGLNRMHPETARLDQLLHAWARALLSSGPAARGEVTSAPLLAVSRAITHLTMRERKVIEGVYLTRIEGDRMDDIAQRLSIGHPTFCASLNSARLKIATTLALLTE